MTVPAFVATAFLFFGFVLITAGLVIIYLIWRHFRKWQPQRERVKAFSCSICSVNTDRKSSKVDDKRFCLCTQAEHIMRHIVNLSNNRKTCEWFYQCIL